MHPRISRLAAVSLATVALGLGTSMTPAQAQPVDGGQSPAWSPGRDTVAAIEDRVARQLASPLADNVRQDLLVAAADQPVHLSTVDGNAALERTIQRADTAVAAAKGLPEDARSLLQVRLAHPDMRAALARGEAPLIAAAPTDDTAAAVTAYGRNGAKVLLDATRIPQQPVFVVEVDTEKALALGLKVMRATLDARGIFSAKSGVTVQGGYWANKVNAIRLNDDKEPWVKGGAEIFGIAGGFGPDSKVRVDTVTMPYLDHDGTTYYPNQVIVHYGFYKYNFADYVMYEDDGDTNYRDLALAIANALLYIVDGGAYQPLVNAIINAMPNSWWTDDPDYTDSWYTLATSTSGRRYGAASNGWMDIVPYWIEQF
ncbi:MAG TPA: DUF3103 family protein [Micromonosporaceae bacterium]